VGSRDIWVPFRRGGLEREKEKGRGREREREGEGGREGRRGTHLVDCALKAGVVLVEKLGALGHVVLEFRVLKEGGRGEGRREGGREGGKEGGRERTYLILLAELFVGHVQVLFLLHQVPLSEGREGGREGGRERARKVSLVLVNHVMFYDPSLPPSLPSSLLGQSSAPSLQYGRH